MTMLTKTQALIVQLLSDGQTPQQVADYRCRSLGTVRKHIELARERLGARTTGHLIKLALKQGLINSLFLCLMLSQLFPSTIDTRRIRAPRSFSVRAGRVRTNEV